MSSTDLYSNVEAIEYNAHDEGGYSLRTYGCSCCSNHNQVGPETARTAALSLLRRLKDQVFAVEEFIAQLDARESGTGVAVGKAE